jgi:hypothetical protein
MKRGAWHQLGWQHQKMVVEQLQQRSGVGVILSPRDLSYSKAQEYVPQYKAAGASVILDPQWHVPEFSNQQLDAYPTAELRASLSSLVDVSDDAIDDLQARLVAENATLQTDAVVAPAVVYAAGRQDIVQVNVRLHEAAQRAASELGKPCYGTAFLGESVTNSQQLVESMMSTITSLECDGWYFGFEFSAERIPSSTDAVYRCLRAAMLLAGTGKPVMHAYAGPMGILSFAAGCVAAATGPSQKQWRFCPERWEPSVGNGGNNAAPARYFSRSLWGTIVFPDEIALLPGDLQGQIVEQSPFASKPLPPTWSKTDATKHLTFSICKGIEQVAAKQGFDACRSEADSILSTAVGLHIKIVKEQMIQLKDDAAGYQANWRAALRILAQNHRDDFEFLELLS